MLCKPTQRYSRSRHVHNSTQSINNQNWCRIKTFLHDPEVCAHQALGIHLPQAFKKNKSTSAEAVTPTSGLLQPLTRAHLAENSSIMLLVLRRTACATTHLAAVPSPLVHTPHLATGDTVLWFPESSNTSCAPGFFAGHS